MKSYNAGTRDYDSGITRGYSREREVIEIIMKSYRDYNEKL